MSRPSELSEYLRQTARLACCLSSQRKVVQERKSRKKERARIIRVKYECVCRHTVSHSCLWAYCFHSRNWNVKVKPIWFRDVLIGNRCLNGLYLFHLLNESVFFCFHKETFLRCWTHSGIKDSAQHYVPSESFRRSFSLHYITPSNIPMFFCSLTCSISLFFRNMKRELLLFLPPGRFSLSYSRAHIRVGKEIKSFSRLKSGQEWGKMFSSLNIVVQLKRRRSIDNEKLCALVQFSMLKHESFRDPFVCPMIEQSHALGYFIHASVFCTSFMNELFFSMRKVFLGNKLLLSRFACRRNIPLLPHPPRTWRFMLIELWAETFFPAFFLITF